MDGPPSGLVRPAVQYSARRGCWWDERQAARHTVETHLLYSSGAGYQEKFFPAENLWFAAKEHHAAARASPGSSFHMPGATAVNFMRVPVLSQDFQASSHRASSAEDVEFLSGRFLPSKAYNGGAFAEGGCNPRPCFIA